MKKDHKEKIIDPRQLIQTIEKIRGQRKTLASLNGSFDLLHAGHLHIIREASKQCDVLIVALNTDSSIQQYKSPNRPIIALAYRLEMMAALGYVDYVTWFEETNPIKILSLIRPDVHVNGSEYGANCIEAQTVKEHGGRVHIVDLIPGLSTSAILTKIYSLKEGKCDSLAR